MMIYQVVPVASAPDSLTAVCPEEKREEKISSSSRVITVQTNKQAYTHY